MTFPIAPASVPSTIGSFPAGPLSLDNIRQAVTNALNADVAIPADHRGAVVLFANGDHVQVTTATRIVNADGGHVTWDVAATIAMPYSGDPTFGVMSKWTF